MGTSIRLEAWRSEKTTDEQWKTFCEDWKELYNEADEPLDDCITSGLIYCSYSNAYVDVQMKMLKKDHTNSKITVNLYYEEREPDEVYVFEEDKEE